MDEQLDVASADTATLIALATAERWEDVYEACHAILEYEDADAIIGNACAQLPRRTGEILLKTAKDAAGEWTMPYTITMGAKEVSGQTYACLFAIPVMPAAGSTLDETEIGRLGDCLTESTDGAPVIMLPRLFSTQDIIGASPGTLRDLVAAVEDAINNPEEADRDPLAILPANPLTVPPVAFGPFAGVGVLLGVRIQPLAADTVELPDIYLHGGPDPEMAEAFRNLAEERCPSLSYIGFPMPIGEAGPTALGNLRMSEALSAVVTARKQADGRVAIHVFDHEDDLFVAVVDASGDCVSDLVIDLRGTWMDAAEAASVLQGSLSGVTIHEDGVTFSNLVRRNHSLN